MRQQVQARPVAALNAFYAYAPGPMRPHLVNGKVKTAASQFREVTMMFIRIGGLHYSDLDFVAKFQRVVYMILSAVYVYKGSLSRVSIDDKGTCVKVTFGLPPLYHNDDPARAVKCGLLVRDQIRPMRLKANVGVSTGTVFIGYVGSESRGEYTEYGVMVNMAARFMGKATNEVLVNQTTHDKALQTDKIDFDVLPAVAMKGMDEPVKMFRAVAIIDQNYYEPELMQGTASRTSRATLHRRSELAEGGADVRMVGRRELATACEAALHHYAQGGDGFAIAVRGLPGMGKTKLVEEICTTLAPREGVLTVESQASSAEVADHLYVWRQIFHALPRLLGLLDTSARPAPGTGGVSNTGVSGSLSAAKVSAVSLLRRVYREWLYKPRFERRPSKMSTVARASSAADAPGGVSLRGAAVFSHASSCSCARNVARESEASCVSDGISAYSSAPTPTAASSRLGQTASTAVSEELYVKGIASSFAEAARQQVERFKKCESLLNDVLDCDFAESDGLLGLADELKADLTIQMLTHMLENALELASHRRALVIIEDAQWMDSASWTLLHRVSEVVSSVSLLITMAPTVAGVGVLSQATAPDSMAAEGASTLVADLAADARKFCESQRLIILDVRPLDREETQALLCARCGVSMVQTEVVDCVCQRTSGNALYCIELANTMLQRGVLKTYNGVLTLSMPIEELDSGVLPNSLQAAISTQLDRLTPQCAACLKAASVMGYIFPAVVLTTLSDDGVPVEQLLSEALQARLIEKVPTSQAHKWQEFLDSNDDERSGGVYRFASQMLVSVAYHSLRFAERRQKHDKIARWIEATVKQVYPGNRREDLDTYFKLWLYQMLAYHWVSTEGEELAAIEYFNLSAKAAMDANMNHEVIKFGKEQVRLLQERSSGAYRIDPDTQRQAALVQMMLAEAYLDQGKVHEAKEVVLAALAVLDKPVEGTHEPLRKRLRSEFMLLARWPGLLREFRTHYALPMPGRDPQAIAAVARLYEHLGRAAYLLEEMDMQDMAVLRCLNLSLLLRSRTKLATANGAAPNAKLRSAYDQLARAYAAACIVDRVAQSPKLNQRFKRESIALAKQIGNPPSLTLYIHMMFGLAAMNEPDWARAESSLQSAVEASKEGYSGRRGEEVLHSLGVSLLFSGKVDAAYETFGKARDQCVERHDLPMLAKLTVGLCVPLICRGDYNEAIGLLESTSEPGTVQEYFNSKASNHANACGLLAMASYKIGKREVARRLAEQALTVFKHSNSDAQVISFFGIAASIEVLLRTLAAAEHVLDYEAAKQASKATARQESSNSRKESFAFRKGSRVQAADSCRVVDAPATSVSGVASMPGAPTASERTTSLGSKASQRVSMAASVRHVASCTSESDVPSSLVSPLDKFRRASAKAGKLAVALGTMEEASPVRVAANKRRASLSQLFTSFNIGSSALAIAVPELNPDQFSLQLLVDALEHLDRFGVRHAAAQPRQLIYAGWLQRIVGHDAEAVDLLRGAYDRAERYCMPYDAALALLVMGQLEAARDHTEAACEQLHHAHTELVRLRMHADATEAHQAIVAIHGRDARLNSGAGAFNPRKAFAFGLRGTGSRRGSQGRGSFVRKGSLRQLRLGSEAHFRLLNGRGRSRSEGTVSDRLTGGVRVSESAEPSAAEPSSLARTFTCATLIGACGGDNAPVHVRSSFAQQAAEAAPMAVTSIEPVSQQNPTWLNMLMSASPCPTTPVAESEGVRHKEAHATDYGLDA